MKTTKGFISPLLLALIAILLIGGGAFVYVQTKNQGNQVVVGTVTSPQSISTAQTSSSQTANWKTYINSQYKFTFQYPTTAKVEIGGYGGGGILNPGQVNFSISFTDHPQDGPGSNGFESIHFDVQPISNLKDTTADGLYQSYVKSLGAFGYTVQKFTVDDDSGVLYFPPVVARPGSGCGAHIDLLHGSYVFSLPSQFGTLFAPQTKIGDCTKNNITVSDDYLKTLSTFKFTK